MSPEELEDYILEKKEAVKEYPFGPDCEVFKVCNKMYALTGRDNDITRVNLKCHPDDVPSLRAMFKGIVPGYHMNKTHWNSVYLDGSVPDDVIKRLVDESYDLVVSKLPKKVRESLNAE